MAGVVRLPASGSSPVAARHGLAAFRDEVFTQSRPPCLHARRLDPLELSVHARRARVLAGQRIGVHEDVFATNLVVENVETESGLRLRLAIEFPVKRLDLVRRCQAHRQSPSPRLGRKHTRSRGPSLRQRYLASTVVRPCPTPAQNQRRFGAVETAARVPLGSPPDYPPYLSHAPRPLPRRIGQAHMSMPSLSARPSPLHCRVGIHIAPFETCSGFTHLTAHRIAQPPKATFVARLRPRQLPGDAARQLPDSWTSIWMEPSSNGLRRRRCSPA